MKWYTRHIGDVTTATSGLTLAEMGAYDRLMDHYYATEQGYAIPYASATYRIAGALTPEEQVTVDKMLARFFYQQDGYWRHAKCDAEIEKYRILNEKRIAGGRIGGMTSSRRKMIVIPSQSQAYGRGSPQAQGQAQGQANQEPITNNKDTPLPPNEERRQAEQTARRLIEYLNQRAGFQYEGAKAHVKLITSRLLEGATEELCRAVIDAKTADWGTDQENRKWLSPDTLFNATKFSKYVGQLKRAEREADKQVMIVIVGYAAADQLGRTITTVKTTKHKLNLFEIAKHVAARNQKMLSLMSAKSIGLNIDGVEGARYALSDLPLPVVFDTGATT